MRRIWLWLALGIILTAPASAQVTIGSTGLTLTTTLTYGSDYVSRGFSQTRGRMTYQGETELVHESGLYLGAFISNARFAYADARQEIDLYGGYRFSLFDVSVDIGMIGYFYPGYSMGRGSNSLDYFEGYVKLARPWGPVNLLGSVSVSPDYFGGNGLGIYIEGGVDWSTGLWDVTLGGRLGYQMIDGNQNFGTPDYLWWGLTASRDFTIDGIGTVTASLGYTATSVARRDCFSPINSALNVCSPRVVGQMSFRF